MEQKTGPAEITPAATAANAGDLSATPAEAPATNAAPSGGDLESRFAALSDQVAALTGSLEEARKAEADAKAAVDAAKVAAERDKMTAAQRHEGDINDLRLQLQIMRDKESAATRAAALDRLGVLAAYRDFAPKVDASTDDGRAALEAWAKSHAELVASQVAPRQAAALMSDALSDVISKNKWVNKTSIADSMKQASALDMKLNSGR